MSDSCTHDCSSCGEKCGERKEAQSFQVAPNSMSSIKKVIGVVSGKGGVGKSLITAMLSVGMHNRGFKTAILDADITGPSIPKMFGLTQKATATEYGIMPVKTRTGIDVMSINLLIDDVTDPVVWRGPVIAGTVKQFWSDVVWEDVDYMFVDMPPGTGDVPLTVFQSLPIDGIVVVTSPQDLVSMIVAKAVKMAQLMNIPILGIVENMSYVECPDCGKKINIYGESKIEQVAAQYGLEVLAQLPIAPKIAASCDGGEIEQINPEPLAKALEKLSAL